MKICLGCFGTHGKNEMFYCHNHNSINLKKSLKDNGFSLLREEQTKQNGEKWSIWTNY